MRDGCFIVKLVKGSCYKSGPLRDGCYIVICRWNRLLEADAIGKDCWWKATASRAAAEVRV